MDDFYTKLIAYKKLEKLTNTDLGKFIDKKRDAFQVAFTKKRLSRLEMLELERVMKGTPSIEELIISIIDSKFKEVFRQINDLKEKYAKDSIRGANLEMDRQMQKRKSNKNKNSA